MTSRFSYVASDRLIWVRSETANIPVYFSLGENFDNYQFKRYRADPREAESLLLRRCKELRSMYSYLRLWFSGGKDSRLALDSFVKNNILLDEIVVVTKGLEYEDQYPHLSPALEINDAALEYLDRVKSLIPKTKINVLEENENWLYAKYSDKDWYKNTVNYSFGCNTIRVLQDVISRVEPNLILKDNCAEINGASTPFLWKKNNIWKFCLTDGCFNNVPPPQYVDFIFDHTSPWLAEYYVNSVANKYDQENKPGEDWLSGNVNDLQRVVQSKCSLYSTIKDFNYFQHSKQYGTNKPLTDELLWKYQTSKTFWALANRWKQQPPSVVEYKNSYWENISKLNQKSILTKTWELT